MKNFFSLLIFLVSLTSVSAQLQKGTWLVGGTAGFTNINSEGLGITMINFSPNAGYFFSNRFALGAMVTCNSLTAENYTTTTLGLTPYIRYYFNDIGSARFFGQGLVGLQSDIAEETSVFNSLIGGLGIGADFFLNDHVAIEGMLGYQRSSYLDNDAPTDVDSFNSIGLNFGVVAFIGRHKEQE